MLRENQRTKRRASGARFAIVASKYNAQYVDAMLRAAQEEFSKARAKVIVLRVPGAYEIPLAVSRLAGKGRSKLAGIVCLGVILRGQTVHAEHIGREVSRALMDLQLEFGVPVIHEVLLLENEEQARRRCLDAKFNRGTEAAQTALEMARVLAGL